MHERTNELYWAILWHAIFQNGDRKKVVSFGRDCTLQILTEGSVKIVLDLIMSESMFSLAILKYGTHRGQIVSRKPALI
jgi:hypothetical protein